MIKFLLMCFLVSQPIETTSMVNAGRRAGARAVVSGTLNPVFTRACEEHVRLMAFYGRQGHQGWLARWSLLQARFPNLRIAEIASESWRGQTLEQAAKDAFTVSWPASPGHWRVANSLCIYYGVSMRRGRNGVTYCSLIVGY